MTIYYPESDTLDCGCNPDWPDHRCLGGRRPSWCCCGAPDDCYCPSPGERLTEILDGLALPAITRVGDTAWMTYTLDDVIHSILSNDGDATVTGADQEIWSI